MAVPEGVALIGLGVSLWRTQRQASSSVQVTPQDAGQAAGGQVAVR
jgi:hypothetical protein